MPCPRVNTERLKFNLLALAEIGREPGGGVTRLAYSPEEARARDWAADRFAELGLAVRLDAAGNLFASRAGRSAPTNLPVMTGSHVDTVPHGGRLDGAAGTVAALEVAHILHESDIPTDRPVEFVVFAAEESPRFNAGHRWGSRALSGQVTTDAAYKLVDANGVSLADAMRRLGLDPDRLAEARRGSGEITAFVELHIEQGTELARAAVPVGIVTSITGTRRYRIELDGRADHSGGTPMGARRDALAAAAEVVLAVENIATQIGASLVGTATTLTVEPNAINVVPGRAMLGVDIRDVKSDALIRASTQFLQALETIGARRGVTASAHLLRDTPPLALSEWVQATIEASAMRAEIPARRVPSHTGHDAASLAPITETGMIFVRNPTGRSHTPDESVEWDDLAAATQVLLETVLTLAGDSP